MAISDQVRSQLFQSPQSSSTDNKMQAIRIPTTRGGATHGGLVPRSPGSGRGLWTPEEHLRFLEALDKFPSGPWKCIAEYVGNKTARQAMTHGQKYRQKIARRRRGLKKIVRDLQFAAVEAQEDEHESGDEYIDARLSVESNPMALSDQDFATFVASLDLAEELQLDALNASPLVVSNTATLDQVIPSFSLEVDVAVPPTSETIDCNLPLTTTQQDVHHWVVMDRADASSEEFSAALAEAFQSGCEEAEAYAFAKALPLPKQLLDEYVQEQINIEPVITMDPTLDGLDGFEFDTFELR
ncbi:Myb-like DNA-binding domain [Phytophthora infestans]|uniref:Myb-like DNA-binding domain n=1 Tax=Phytophthora infestans TaxID=4787 RepID=A0A8S9UAG6_PHYIN|nr:Myb-like DNA-binding domain [Phytophthora infestans]KAI9990284.1 hypothetical protein PInf_021094 [Phytophthora infestans]KAI9997876.1 hypothetical protein PInf_002133 [Phytophthora infestans]